MCYSVVPVAGFLLGDLQKGGVKQQSTPPAESVGADYVTHPHQTPIEIGNTIRVEVRILEGAQYQERGNVCQKK